MVCIGREWKWRRVNTVTQDSASLQVAAQLHALLQEKAMLASENERLLRENCGLQVCPTPQAQAARMQVPAPDLHTLPRSTQPRSTTNTLICLHYHPFRNVLRPAKAFSCWLRAGASAVHSTGGRQRQWVRRRRCSRQRGLAFHPLGQPLTICIPRLAIVGGS